MTSIYIIVATSIVILIFLLLRNSKKWNKPVIPIPEAWKQIIINYIPFYSTLSDDEKKRFEFSVQEFLLNCTITGVKLTPSLTDKLLIASSAIIPIFAFPKWRYTNLNEILLYPDAFNDNFDTDGPNRYITGMVGSGILENKMVLSKRALYHGFENEMDKKNTAIHEFVHLIDMMDGNADGIPEVLLSKQYSIPWIDMMNKEIERICKNDSNINPYGATNRTEFFAVISEYFFERPKLLQKVHPDLYAMLEMIFNQDMKSRDLNLLRKESTSTGRNASCPCNSGKKFKHCCGKSI